MKKAMLWFSLTVILIFSVYVSYKMTVSLEQHPTYEGIAQEIVDRTIDQTGAVNSVTAIVFDFRGYDTLGESFVLFTAVTGAAVILRKQIKAKEDH
ncbi:hydrogen gas-evolving membrane-bound hydrogenase subunit E [Clostridium thermarum]|uniref:hydrogen gas-evolving membrane-bound hydrogenase subunit E n=1 Tax=Clostridium thermarum TaxID=1716543 RepID=UPI0013D539A5|nr:hydrogen gas-evolving membrane-bound hydrogenase subunit E [Clostridium thermarum]